MSFLAYVYTVLPFVVALVLGLGVPVLLMATYRGTRRIGDTHKVQAMLWIVAIGAALTTLLVKRTLNMDAIDHEMAGLTYSSVYGSSNWASRIATLALLALASAEVIRRVLERWSGRGQRPPPDTAVFVTVAMLFFYVGTYVFQLVGAETKTFSLKLFYSPLVLLAALLLRDIDIEVFTRHLKLALLIPVFGSLLAMGVAPDFALHRPSPGLIPGIDFRLFGITPHPNALGQIGLLAIFLEYVHPYRNRWAKWAVVLGALAVLVLAQSKTVWLAALAVSMLVVLPIEVERRLRAGPLWQMRGLVVAFVFLALAFAVAFVVALGGDKIAAFFEEHQDLLTATGRTSIWDITLRTWLQNPLFGYGPDLWSIPFRIKHGMLHVGQAHNQFMQTLGEAGLLGMGLLLAYLYALGAPALRYNRAARGLTLSLFILVLFRCMSEAPFRGGLLNWDFLVHLALVVYTAHFLRLHRQPASQTALSQGAGDAGSLPAGSRLPRAARRYGVS